MTRVSTAVAILTITASAALAQQPRISNGDLQVQPLSGPLDRAIAAASRATDPRWIGYAVPSANPDSNMCCWNNGSKMGCNLEPGAPGGNMTGSNASAIRLDSGDMFFVLYRVEQGQVTRIRTFSEECPLDAGGRVVSWLTGVNARESVAFLSTHVTSAEQKTAAAALSALAMHADTTALDALARFARTADSSHVRGQALFWLAHRAGQKAIGTITEAIEKDPETEVKRRAVFALSQLPTDEGVPLLINVARTNRNAAVRKHAIFWLGQSKDPRALKFFEEILFK